MKGTWLALVVGFAAIVCCILLSQRMDTISGSLDDIHKDAIDLDKALYSNLVTNMNVAYGELGYLANNAEEDRAVTTILVRRINQLEKIVQIQNAYMNYMLLEEMGSKDFKKASEKFGEQIKNANSKTPAK